MKKPKIAIIFGTRPEIIKLAGLVKTMAKFVHRFKILTINTGQHDELAGENLNYFGLRADYNLKIMQNNQSSLQIIKNLFPLLGPVLKQERPDLLLVQGDTTTAFAASLCAFYLSIPVAHIEAGLRTYDNSAPFPEEANRRLISVLARLHFAPSILAKQNLIAEGLEAKKIFVVGNTGIDALLATLKKNQGRAPAPVFKNIDFNKRVLVFTLHRRENYGKNLSGICRLIAALIKQNKEIEIVFVLHPNPNIKNKLLAGLSNIQNLHLLRPLNYGDFIYLLNRSYLILTDSGGIQEESVYLQKPVLVIRDNTERPEIVNIGVGKLTGARPREILKSVKKLLNDPKEYRRMTTMLSPYGRGRAAHKIIPVISNYLKRLTVS